MTLLKLLLTLWFALLPPWQQPQGGVTAPGGGGGGGSSIAFDGVGAGASFFSAASAITWNHTVTSNTNGVIVVGCGFDGGSSTTRTMSSVTYNSVALTKGPTRDDNTNAIHTEIWYSTAAPATGTHTVSATPNGTNSGYGCNSMSFTGAAASAPNGATAGANGTSTTPSVSNTTATNNSWVVDAVLYDSSSSSCTTTATGTSPTQTKEYGFTGNSDQVTYMGSYKGPKTPAGATTMSWSVGVCGSASWVTTSLELKPGP